VTVYLVEAMLWSLVAGLALATAVKGRILFREGAREGATDFVRLLPKVLLGVVGSGYVVAILAGTFTPGGPVVGFSMGAAAIKSGAGAPQVIAYVTAWALFAIQRFFIWELPIMPHRLVWIRVLASLPLPLLVAGTAILIGRP
jgi:hypothetical protein